MYSPQKIVINLQNTKECFNNDSHSPQMMCTSGRIHLYREYTSYKPNTIRGISSSVILTLESGDTALEKGVTQEETP